MGGQRAVEMVLWGSALKARGLCLLRCHWMWGLRVPSGQVVPASTHFCPEPFLMSLKDRAALYPLRMSRSSSIAYSLASNLRTGTMAPASLGALLPVGSLPMLQAKVEYVGDTYRQVHLGCTPIGNSNSYPLLSTLWARYFMYL